MQSMPSYLQVHLCCDACIIMLATIIIYASFHKCTPSYDNTSCKQSCKQKQKTSQTITSHGTISNDHANSIIKITWIRSIQYPRVVTLQHGSRRQETIYEFQNITQNKRRRTMAQTPFSHLPFHSHRLNLLLAVESRSESTLFHPNSPFILTQPLILISYTLRKSTTYKTISGSRRGYKPLHFFSTNVSINILSLSEHEYMLARTRILRLVRFILPLLSHPIAPTVVQRSISPAEDDIIKSIYTILRIGDRIDVRNSI